MEITLEQIELVKDRTGVSYKEAKEALEAVNGNVVDAIIYIEEHIDSEYSAKDKSAADKMVKNIKEAVRKGNVTKLRVYRGEEVILSLPVTFGIVGTVLFPWGAVFSAIAAAVTKCRVELIKEDGSVVNISEKTGAAYDTVKDKGAVVMDEVIDKGAELYVNAKAVSTGIYETAKEKGADLYETAKEKGVDIYAAAKDKAGDLSDRFGKKSKACDETPEGSVVDVTETVEPVAPACEECAKPEE